MNAMSNNAETLILRGNCRVSTKHYVVRTKPCHEAIARANLIDMGFESYVPTVREEVRTRTARFSTLVPMFPGYIFVSLDLSNPDWREACSAKGVVELLPGSNRPTAVPEHAMTWVREMEASENAKRALGPVAHVVAGDEVTVTMRDGTVLDGVCQLSRKERVMVLLTMMGVAARLTVPAESVKRRAG